MSIKISVVIATYKRPQLLIKCLDALMRQKLRKEEFEIIVVSDGPDDATALIIKTLNNENNITIKYSFLSEKKGPAAARNYGWRQAVGELIAFTDDDCIPHQNWLQAFYISYYPGKVMAFRGKTIVPVTERPTDYELNTAHLQNADFITANCCCTRSALEITGGFDEQFSMAWREDSDLEFKLFAEKIPIRKIEDAIIVHPVRKADWGISIKEQKKTMFNVLLYKKFPHLYRKKIQSLPPYIYYATILSFTIMLCGLLAKSAIFSQAGFITWLLLVIIFIVRRLQNTSLSFSHIFEMVITSLIIPFLSVYWQWYGVFKYRALLI